MLELGVGADILRGLGWLYIGLIALLVGAALWFPQRWWQKVTGVAVVLLIFTGPAYLRNREREQIVDERKARFEKAKALFDERCKTAGEKIYRTVDDVEGFVWERWRPRETNYGDQFALTDPYGRDCGGEECIKSMLQATRGAELNSQEAHHYSRGYRFIESVDPTDGGSFRYTGEIKLPDSWTPEKVAQRKRESGGALPSYSYRFVLVRQPNDRPVARYGVTWVDISKPEDRSYWIAGGSIRIVDLQTKELIAERSGYLIDPGQGSTAGQRSPWTWTRNSTNACPPVRGHNLEFIRSVLKPKQGE